MRSVPIVPGRYMIARTLIDDMTYLESLGLIRRQVEAPAFGSPMSQMEFLPLAEMISRVLE